MIKVYCEEHQFVHNICHLMMDNMFPMYVALKSLDLLDKEIVMTLRKRPPQHRLLVPDIYRMFNARVGYAPAKEIISGKLVAYTETERKETLHFHPEPDDPNQCTCSNVGQYNKKEACNKNHYINISNKRFFPYVGEFSDFVLKWLNLPPIEPKYITIVKRRTYRVILNHDELVAGLKTIGLVREVFMEDLSFKEQMEVVRKSKVFITSHGAASSYAMFVPNGCTSLEILPYQYAYDRFSKLALARGEKYIQWTNPDESKTQRVYSAAWLGNVDTSITPVMDPMVIKKDGKSGEELKKANKLRGWFRDQNTIVDVNAIKDLVAASLT